MGHKDWSIAEQRNPSDQPGRWVTINGAHVFIPDAPGGKAEKNHTPNNVVAKPATHAPGRENLLLSIAPSANEATFVKHGVTRKEVIEAHTRKHGRRDPITHRQMETQDRELHSHLLFGGGDYYDPKTKSFRRR